jgi:hypothetical protein
LTVAKALTLFTPRISLFFIAILFKLAYTSLTGGPYIVNQTKAVWGMFFWAAWFAVLWLVALPQTDVWLARWSQQLKKVAIGGAILLAVIGLGVAGVFIGLKADLIKPASFNTPIDELLTYFKSQPRYSDGAAMAQQATENFVEGKNPYAEANVITAMEEWDGQSDDNGPFVNLTPLQEGRFADVFPYPTEEELDALWTESKATPEIIPVEMESKFTYPAGAFLISAPLFLAGIDNLQIIVGGFLMLAIAFGLWRSPRGSRILFAIAVAVSLELWISGMIGLEKRLVIFPFMLAGWLLIPKHPKLATLLLGIGAATYQTVWFLVPFAAVYVYHLKGMKDAVVGLIIAATAFLAINMPFIAADPVLWFTSVFAPMFDKLYPLGVGLVSLTETSIITIQASTIFTVLEMAALGGGLWWYFRNGGKYPATGLLLSVFPVFFAWRSLGTYFYYVDIILLAVVLIEYHARKNAPATMGEVTV